MKRTAAKKTTAVDQDAVAQETAPEPVTAGEES